MWVVYPHKLTPICCCEYWNVWGRFVPYLRRDDLACGVHGVENVVANDSCLGACASPNIAEAVALQSDEIGGSLSVYRAVGTGKSSTQNIAF